MALEDLNYFENIYIHHWEKLYSFCFKMTRDEHISQNIIQDIFTDLWERRSELQIISIENYLFRAAKNQVLREYRRRKFDTTTIDEKFDHYLTENASSSETEIKEQLYSLLEILPQKRKEILIMNKIEEMDIDQIAATLRISKQTVKNQLTMALKQLRVHAVESSIASLSTLVVVFIIS